MSTIKSQSIQVKKEDKWTFRILLHESLQDRNDTGEFVFRLDRHSYSRILQRRITLEEIGIALVWGTSFYIQGLTFTVVTRKMIYRNIALEPFDMENLIVVHNENSGFIKTCYRRKSAISYLKRKIKYSKPPRRRYILTKAIYNQSNLFQPFIEIPERLGKRKKRSV